MLQQKNYKNYGFLYVGMVSKRIAKKKKIKWKYKTRTAEFVAREWWCLRAKAYYILVNRENQRYWKFFR